MSLEKIIVGPEEATSAVIWLHGLGADGHDFAPIVPALNLKASAQVRFIFPHAPMQPVTLNQGVVMRAWYDIREINARAEEDEQGIRKIEAEVKDLIEEQIKAGIPSQKIILAGFSQGGGVALFTGLRFEKPLGGILALSTYLPLPHLLEVEKHPANQTIPIWMAHGSVDDIVPLSIAKMALQHLKKHGYSVEWQTFEMGHQVCPEELTLIKKWLEKRFNP